MRDESDIQHSRDCFFNIHVHWIFVAKYRRYVLDARVIKPLRSIFASVCSDARVTLVEMDGEDDHGHMLVEYP